jgi:predicted O-methyltransferase YrrM
MKIIRVGPVEILGLNFDETMEPYFQGGYSDPYFALSAGREHYRLLSYLSTQFQNTNILDVGTACGHSALALTYNKTNTVHSFDIANYVKNEKIRNNPSIKYYLEDLWDPINAAKYTDLIKSCPLIFLDVDPHEGHMEIQFYQFLKLIGYKGIVVCDDIRHFEGMRRFWAQIPENEKYDITQYGHWSGTGLIVFDNTKFEFI